MAAHLPMAASSDGTEEDTADEMAATRAALRLAAAEHGVAEEMARRRTSETKKGTRRDAARHWQPHPRHLEAAPEQGAQAASARYAAVWQGAHDLSRIRADVSVALGAR